MPIAIVWRGKFADAMVGVIGEGCHGWGDWGGETTYIYKVRYIFW